VNAYNADSRERLSDAERTDLAWNRSGLALLACGAVVLRGLTRPGLPKREVAAGVVILFLGTLTWALGAWHAHRTLRRGGRPTVIADLLPISCGVALVGVGAFVVAAVFPG
jgi:uncharacterized membrane protein YidH (DUF202 family)